METNMKTYKEILLEICWWEDMENLTNTPIRYPEQAAELYAQQFKDENIELLSKNSVLILEKFSLENEIKRLKEVNEAAGKVITCHFDEEYKNAWREMRLAGQVTQKQREAIDLIDAYELTIQHKKT